jgi:Fe-S-cluster containining protein
VCCRYIALPIEKPTTRRDFDDIRWYVMHDGISVFLEEGDWYIQIRAKCRNLEADSRCSIYPTRPGICREYKAGDCDYEGGDYHYEVILRTPEEVEEFAKSRSGKKSASLKDEVAVSGRGTPRIKRLKMVYRNDG